MYICVTEVDHSTKIPCTSAPMQTGPSMPIIKGLKLDWTDKSTWPVELSNTGVYLRAPKYYGTCDEDADLSVPGVLEVLTKEEFNTRKQAEFQSRKPYASWLWNENLGEWVAPLEKPNDDVSKGGRVIYEWSEPAFMWIAINVY